MILKNIKKALILSLVVATTLLMAINANAQHEYDKLKIRVGGTEVVVPVEIRDAAGVVAAKEAAPAVVRVTWRKGEEFIIVDQLDGNTAVALAAVGPGAKGRIAPAKETATAYFFNPTDLGMREGETADIYVYAKKIRVRK